MEQRKALGRGLASLIPRAEPSEEGGLAVREVSLEEIKPAPNQPRKFFDEDRIAELAESIKEQGILHPLLVRQVAAGYELISGERRWRAAKKIGMVCVPVIVRDVAPQEQLELALVENLQRADLDPIEEARAYADLMTRFSLTQERVADKVAKSRSAVANSLRLLKLPEKLQEGLQSGALSVGHAKVLLAEPIDRQLALYGLILKEGLSVRELETKVQQSLPAGAPGTRKKAEAKVKTLSGPIARVVDELRTLLGTKVEIDEKKNGSGRILIEYYSQDQLDELYQKLTGLFLTKRKTRRT